jgi:NAD(P)-dependent dehydrogenase (short-subunit alcohol dehydrogenase family)
VSARAFRDAAVLLTGAAGGIGSALARRFARGGARLGLLDRDGEAVRALCEELGGSAQAVTCDVASRDSCAAGVAELSERLGGVDVLINNAGITHVSRFAETDAEVLQRVMEVNFFGAIHCTQASLPALIERRGLVIVISSVAGFAPLAGRAGYAASKHALQGLFESIRPELAASGVGVTIVCPGFVDTPIEAHALGGAGGRPEQKRTTVGRLTSPDTVADAIFRAASRRRKLLVLSAVGKASYALTRIAPGLYERVMTRRLLR